MARKKILKSAAESVLDATDDFLSRFLVPGKPSRKQPRQKWSELKPGTRKRKLGYYRKQGLSDRQIAARYNAGTLGRQTVARGHLNTPEKGMAEALRHPAKYHDYIAKRNQPPVTGSPEDEAYALNQARDRAYKNTFDRLHEYIYFNADTVWANVYGGETLESGKANGMSLSQAEWTAGADTEEIRSMAEDQYKKNPWFYH